MPSRSKTITDLEKFRKVLKSHGLKATPQRLAVHEAMMALGHACADKVSEYISEHCDTPVTTSSVYNILTQMTGIGIYAQRLSADSRMYFDIIPAQHVHLYDSINHEYRDIMDDGLLEIVNSYVKRKRFKGYKVDGIDVQIVCHPTRKKQGN